MEDVEATLESVVKYTVTFVDFSFVVFGVFSFEIYLEASVVNVVVFTSFSIGSFKIETSKLDKTGFLEVSNLLFNVVIGSVVSVVT